MALTAAFSPSAPPPERRGRAKGEFDFTDAWYPIQVKQKDRVGRPDIDAFIGMMTQHDKSRGQS
jgi:hypothetical protein